MKLLAIAAALLALSTQQTFAQFERALQAGKVRSATVFTDENRIDYEAISDGRPRPFTTGYPEDAEGRLVSRLIGSGIRVNVTSRRDPGGDGLGIAVAVAAGLAACAGAFAWRRRGR